MAKKGVTYEQTVQACEALLKDGQAITLRTILSHTGGSPNNVIRHWHRWQQERASQTLENLEDDFSSELKQAIRADWARKSQVLRADYDYLRKITTQQVADLQSLLDARIEEKEQLRLDIGIAKNQLREQEKKTAVAEQRASDCAERLKEIEKRFLVGEKEKERITTEKSMLEKQMADLQARFTRLEKQHEQLQTNKHQLDVEVATLRARTGTKK